MRIRKSCSCSRRKRHATRTKPTSGMYYRRWINRRGRDCASGCRWSTRVTPGSKESDPTVGVRELSAMEVAASCRAGEDQCGAGWVLGIADADKVVREEC